MSNILQELESEIAALKTSVSKSNVGIVREIGDGVAKVEGLSNVMLNEMIEFPGGLYGLALNLEETEVGCILLGDGLNVKEGDEVKSTGRLLSVPVGREMLGRVVDSLGGHGAVRAEHRLQPKALLVCQWPAPDGGIRHALLHGGRPGRGAAQSLCK